MATKMELDFNSAIDETIAKYRRVAEEGNLNLAIEGLLAHEKQARTAADVTSTGKVLVAIVELCYESKEFDSLKENILFLNKRRSQLKGAIKMMVKRCMKFLDHMPYEKKMALINTLISVTEGKIFVEKQRARLTRILASICESEGKITEATSLLLQIQVETFTSMSKKEKLEFILEQMRLCLLKKDYIRTQIISRKISPKSFVDPEFKELKIRYHTLMVNYYEHNRDYLNAYRAYQEIYMIPIIQEDEEASKHYLSLSVAHLLLAPYDNEQNDALHRLAMVKQLSTMPACEYAIKSFIKMELLDFKLWAAKMEPEFSKLSLFQASDSPQGKERMDEFWKDLHIRTTAHNLLVIAKYYSHIHMDRLAQLLNLSHNECEKHLRDLVSRQIIYARINRIEGTIQFVKKQEPSEILNEWASHISQLLSLVDKTCHLIDRENMIHGQSHVRTEQASEPEKVAEAS